MQEAKPEGNCKFAPCFFSHSSRLPHLPACLLFLLLAFLYLFPLYESMDFLFSIAHVCRHIQVAAMMRKDQPHVKHQFDPWHVAKSVRKDLLAASKKRECANLGPWISSIVNHLWLKFKWLRFKCQQYQQILPLLPVGASKTSFLSTCLGFNNCSHYKQMLIKTRLRNFVRPTSLFFYLTY